jgi:hypothetical protein
MGIWAAGALLYTFLLKFAIPIYTGKLRFETKERKEYGVRHFEYDKSGRPEVK